MDPVVVIGGGLSGLACGFELARAGVAVRVVEARARAGGVVGTERRDGFLFEDGPNTVPSTAVELVRLSRELGLDGRMITSLPEARDRFIYKEGRLRPLPRGPLSFATTSLLSARGKLALLGEPFRRHRPLPAGAPEPELGAFLAERLGAEAARVLAGAFVRGVYAAELDELGARSAFPRLWAMAQEHGGLVRGMLARRKAGGRSDVEPEPLEPGGRELPRGALISFAEGLGELPRALATALGDALVLGRGATRLERAGDGYAVTLADGERLAAAGVVLATSARVAAALLEPLTDTATLAPLADLPHARVTLVHLGFAPARGGERLLPDGFGYLVPPGGPAITGERAPRALGTIFTSNLFAGRAPEGGAATTSFHRTADLERELGARAHDEAALARLAADDLSRALGRAVPEPAHVRVKAWDDVIPRYGPGHADAMTALEATLAERLPGVALAGNFIGGVSVEQVVARGRTTARTIAERYDRRSERPSGPPSSTGSAERGIGARP